MPKYDPDFDFKGNSDRLLIAMRVIAESVDLEQMLVVLDYTHALAPMLDPTAYRDMLHRGDAETVGRLCSSLRAAVEIFNEKIAPKLPVSS